MPRQSDAANGCQSGAGRWVGEADGRALNGFVDPLSGGGELGPGRGRDRPRNFPDRATHCGFGCPEGSNCNARPCRPRSSSQPQGNSGPSLSPPNVELGARLGTGGTTDRGGGRSNPLCQPRFLRTLSRPRRLPPGSCQASLMLGRGVGGAI